MSFTLPNDLSEFVQAELSAGRYSSAGELLCDGLRQLRSRRERLEKFRQEELQPSLDRLDRGEGLVIPADQMRPFLENLLAEVIAELDAGAKKSA